jgi:hypothetical protein
MLAAEHEAAEVLRDARLKACTVRTEGYYSLRWLFGLFGTACIG